MKESEFNNLVDQLRDDPLPSCPENLEQNVLRRIRLAKGHEESTMDWLGSWLIRPAFLATAIAIVAISSFVTANYFARPSIQENPALALGLDVFAEVIILPTDH